MFSVFLSYSCSIAPTINGFVLYCNINLVWYLMYFVVTIEKIEIIEKSKTNRYLFSYCMAKILPIVRILFEFEFVLILFV